MRKFSTDEQQELWEEIISSNSHYFRPIVRIYNGTKTSATSEAYRQQYILEMSTDMRVFSDEQPSVGGCLAGELTVKMLKPEQNIPRMALVIPYIQAVDGEVGSSWVPQGRYFIDTRETTENDDGLDILTLHCYDAMLKTEADYPMNVSHDWPALPLVVVQDIASKIGVGIESGTQTLLSSIENESSSVQDAYKIGMPVGYSMREVLSAVGGMFCGNWIMNFDGQLKLITLDGIPAATNYLVTPLDEPITFGSGDNEVRILV